MDTKTIKLPSNWLITSIESICEILDSQRIPVNNAERSARITGKKSSQLYPYYGATGKVGEIDDFIFEGEYVLVGEDGAPFLEPAKSKAYIATGKFWVNNHAHILKSHTSNKYLCHYLNLFNYADFVTGTTRLKLNQAALKTIPVVFPPLNEQKRIVAKIEELFSELDNGIAALKTAREQLKVYRQAVLKHAFEGKLTAKWREENADKLETPEQLLARIQKERNARYQQQLEEWKAAMQEWEAKGRAGKKPCKPNKPTEIRELQNDILPPLPKGWCWVEYDGICEQIRNGISAKPCGEAGAKIFRISAVRPMEFNLEDIRYLKNEDGQFDKYFLGKGDLVFTRYNGTRDYVGVCAEYHGDGTHLYPDKLIQTRVAVKFISPSYLEKAINCGGSRRYIELRIRTTAGQAGISGEDIKSMPIPVCSAEEQKIIEEHIAEQLSHIASMNAEIGSGIVRAEILRQSILKKAFSGQLVPQDPNDEPASELLSQIRAKKDILKGKL
ncbi:MAG: hypothetical protein K0S08_721 [Gammaproteobacteria bacterium]|jgi:type I restriction enzyme S subunit|nr:hypothetical protein [Gammaproteobacteria bacterium]